VTTRVAPSTVLTSGGVTAIDPTWRAYFRRRLARDAEQVASPVDVLPPQATEPSYGWPRSTAPQQRSALGQGEVISSKQDLTSQSRIHLGDALLDRS